MDQVNWYKIFTQADAQVWDFSAKMVPAAEETLVHLHSVQNFPLIIFHRGNGGVVFPLYR